MKHVLDAVVSRFVTLYGEPRTDSAEALYSEYVRALKDFDEQALELAVDEIVKSHTFPSWPTPGEVYKQAVTEASKLYAKRPRPPVEDPPRRDDGRFVLSEEQKAANRRMIDELKRQTLTQDWERPNLPAPTREFMEDLQAQSMRTVDGRNRHMRGWVPDLKSDGAPE